MKNLYMIKQTVLIVNPYALEKEINENIEYFFNNKKDALKKFNHIKLIENSELKMSINPTAMLITELFKKEETTNFLGHFEDEIQIKFFIDIMKKARKRAKRLSNEQKSKK